MPTRLPPGVTCCGAAGEGNEGEPTVWLLSPRVKKSAIDKLVKI